MADVEEVRASLAKNGVVVSQERMEELTAAMTEFRPKVDELFEMDVDGLEAASAFNAGWGRPEDPR